MLEVLWLFRLDLVFLTCLKANNTEEAVRHEQLFGETVPIITVNDIIRLPREYTI
jgi:hypothetical protein